MFRRFSINFALLSIFLDAVIVAGSLVISARSRPFFDQTPGIQPVFAPVVVPMLLYIAFPLIWVGMLLLQSVYDGRRNLRAADEMGSLTLATAIAAISMAGVLYLSFRDISRFMFIFFVMLGYVLLVIWRLAARLVFARNGGLSAQRRVLIAGAGEVGMRLREQIMSRPYLGLNLVGFLDDDPAKQSALPWVLGGLDLARQVIAEQRVDDVVIALPRPAYKRLNQLVAVLHDLPVKVWIIPDYFSLALHRATVVEFAGIPMLDIRAPALNDYQRMVKRGFDLLLVIVALPVLLPVMLLIALAIRVDSRGPVLYRQKRVGENGHIFQMVKFRTMVANAERLRHLVEQVDEDGRLIQNKNPDDPRVTRVGRRLRHASLDELPQLWNVLRGDMSLVGPRPELPYLVEKYDLWQRRRFAVPQGMTGWWQVNGRSDRPLHLNTEDDIYYVQHYSIWLDLQILVRTVWVVLRGKGAY